MSKISLLSPSKYILDFCKYLTVLYCLDRIWY